MRWLFLSRWFPHPADNGSRLRILNLLRQLAARHTVHLISFSSGPVSAQSWAALRAVCPQVATVPDQPYRPWSGRAVAGLFDLQPRSVRATFSPELAGLVRRAVRDYAFDGVIASEIDMAPYALSAPAPRRVLEDLEVAVGQERRRQARSWPGRLRAGLAWWKQARYVRGLLGAFDLCTLVSESEAEKVLPLAPARARLAVVPNGVDLAAYRGAYPPPAPETVIYSGALTYSANFDAVDFFLREVWPRVRAALPAARLTVTGGLEGVAVERLPHSPGVTYTGYLPDVRPAIAGHWASVVPLRLGAGTRLKILEALALGTPVVSTTKGAEGLDLVPGRDVLIADEAAGLAEALVRLLREPGLRAWLARHGRAAVEARYDWNAIGRDFVQRLEALPAGRPG